LTPMTDADLRQVLALQTTLAVTHTPIKVVSQGAAAIAAHIAGQPPSMVIVDAIADDDLRAIGQAGKDRKLLTGGSGIAIGLPINFGIASKTVPWTAVAGPGAVLSGSCSRATRAQVAAYLKTNPGREITAAEVVERDGQVDDLVEWALGQPEKRLVPPLRASRRRT